MGTGALHYRIVYSSRNRITGSQEEVASQIDAILTVSRLNNAASDITGALLFNGRAFAQVLEGPRDVVEHTFAKIRLDTRHSNVTTLEQAYQVQRHFRNWAMAYSDPASLEVEPLNFQPIGADPGGFASQILNLLKSLVDAFPDETA